MKSSHAIAGLLLATVLGIGAWVALDQRSTAQAPATESTPVYVGAQSCASCHAPQFTAWKGSHHEQAMQHANDKTVLGDFNDAGFTYNGISSRFFKRDGRFFVNTDGADGSLQDFEIKYTFGVYPLQQYLIEFPGGRMQALALSWDARPQAEGGQRWFHQYPMEKVDHKDELHWTKLSQNWNYMCAECHSTELKKNYDLASNTFKTKWAEINVSCEACHGPASAHLTWAAEPAKAHTMPNKGLVHRLDERKNVSWNFVGEGKVAERSQPRNTSKEIDTCARCHARRSTLSEDYQHGKPLLDSHLPALLSPPLFHPDGQIKEEDFEYASFLQSKMHSKGVTCTDCHDPHSQKLRAPGNTVCLTCHRADQYVTETHHHHKQDSKGAECVACHMPTQNFMVVHARHDHSIRVPRPDLSIKLNTPNACNQCHTDKSATWASRAMQQWYGKGWMENWHFGESLHAANQGQLTAGPDLMALAASPKFPDIARASAANALARYVDQATFAVVPRLLKDPSPLVRRSALLPLEALAPEQRWRLAGGLLTDPVLAVRFEAARVLAPVPRNSLSTNEQALLERGIAEYIKVAHTNAEHPQSHINLGLLYSALGDQGKAEQAYQQALRLDPAYASAYVNLADLYSQQQGDKAEAILLQARSVLGEHADIEHAIGLHYVRAQQMKPALASLGKAASLSPENARYTYVHAVALFDSGEKERAIRLLAEASVRYPNDVDILMALVSYHKQQGRMAQARRYAELLVKKAPGIWSADAILQQ
ncbi:tetratricopeptide repeat protein [Uliginosibacterium sp. TH139]|uniref:tetratricopeptide repeat protein n=1 Tax=Uliginosibacterium sp. TH139 TaxID=2067453 RepID=UPI000C7C6F9B|nr:tetratricopeptide repeat protein [Uliginosibacterium sp. TH139]PLK49947.1 hypothetical protein C0V76_05900 [Uliginosibacterium sp. TH139]